MMTAEENEIYGCNIVYWNFMSNREDCINRRKPQIYSESINYNKRNLLQCQFSKIIDIDLISATLNVPWIINRSMEIKF